MLPFTNKNAVLKNTDKGTFIPLAKPFISEEDIAVVNNVLRSGMLVQGEYVARLEESFAHYHNVKHAIAVANGTATMHLALSALGIGKGDEVIVPAFSFMATANVVELVGATPVFVDIDSATFNIDVTQLEEKITSKTKAIIPVHQFGMACNIAAVTAVAGQYNLHLVEDAACALGATYEGKKAGTFGIAASFSLHPRKSITSGEGGVLLTNDDALATKLRQLRNHGIELQNGRTEFVESGYNYRITDFQAALAWSQFQRLNAILDKKNKVAVKYFSALTNTKLSLPFVPSACNHTWQTFHILLDDSLDQQHTIQKLKDQGIGTNNGAQCIPAQIYYQDKYGLNVKALFPNAYRAYTKGLAIPMFPCLTHEETLYIAQTLNQLT